MIKYFLICASRDHVLMGIEQQIAQAGHGRKDFISKPAKGDWIVYYSSRDKFEGGNMYQKFTAVGEITDDEPYQESAHGNFKPYRRKVNYKVSHEADIRPLIERLSFIKNKKRWGFYLMSGFREIPKEDFKVIRRAMK